MDEILAVIRAERLRQIEQEGWTPQHDDRHKNEQLADAAAAYATSDDVLADRLWPWTDEVSIGVKCSTKFRSRQLVIAAALIIAELERRKRAGLP